jgi:hypothetical protein
MKTKIAVTTLAVLFSTVLFAQKMTYDAGRTTFGVRGGVNFATITGKNASGTKYDNNINTGYHIGVNAEIPVGTGTYIQPGLLYSQKGAEFKGNNGNSEVDVNYLEVPVNFVYKPILGTGRMLLGFGPYVGFGLNGQVKGSNGTKTDVEFTKNYNPAEGPANAQFRRIDGGGNLLAGYEFKNNLSFQINAQLGLTQLAPDINGEDNPAVTKNTNFGLSVGYRF